MGLNFLCISMVMNKPEIKIHAILYRKHIRSLSVTSVVYMGPTFDDEVKKNIEMHRLARTLLTRVPRSVPVALINRPSYVRLEFHHMVEGSKIDL